MTKASCTETHKKLDLDYAGMWDAAEERAKREAGLMYPPHMDQHRKRCARDLALKYFRQMYYPQR
jgi:hypothetical protein